MTSMFLVEHNYNYFLVRFAFLTIKHCKKRFINKTELNNKLSFEKMRKPYERIRNCLYESFEVIWIIALLWNISYDLLEYHIRPDSKLKAKFV